MPNVVAIVGRPNVGKSTLFNRLTETRQAIVEETAGVTRDRHYGKVEWTGVEFSIIDTGGYILGSEDVFEKEIRLQVQIAIDESQLILFVVDVTDGVTVFDREVAHVIRKSKKPVILVANKADNGERTHYAGDFYSLGLGDVFAISAINGSGTGDLMDEVIKQLPPDVPFIQDNLPKFAIVGRPNVGKSSLTNALLGENRNIVTSVAGTTRDAIHSRYTKYGHDFWLIDTAGMRRKAKVKEDLEFYSVMRTINAIEHCDVCILMLDATQEEDSKGIESQDVNILSLALKNRKGLVILVNKWDLVEKETNTIKQIEDSIRAKTAPFTDYPILFISATEKQRILKAVDVAMEVYENRTKHIPTRKLNDFLLPLIEHYPAPAINGHYVKVKYATQLKNQPIFILSCNSPQYITESYKRFLENKIRAEFGFTGVPLTLNFRKK